MSLSGVAAPYRSRLEGCKLLFFLSLCTSLSFVPHSFLVAAPLLCIETRLGRSKASARQFIVQSPCPYQPLPYRASRLPYAPLINSRHASVEILKSLLDCLGYISSVKSLLPYSPTHCTMFSSLQVRNLSLLGHKSVLPCSSDESPNNLAVGLCLCQVFDICPLHANQVQSAAALCIRANGALTNECSCHTIAQACS